MSELLQFIIVIAFGALCFGRGYLTAFIVTIRSQPQNFIPYLGPLVAGYDNQSSSVTFTFAQNGVLTGTTSSQSGVAAGANLAAGPNAATRPYEAVR